MNMYDVSIKKQLHQIFNLKSFNILNMHLKNCCTYSIFRNVLRIMKRIDRLQNVYHV